MSAASFGIRASVPFQNPPGVPADAIPLLGGPRADVQWEVIQNGVFTVGTVVPGPWDKSGGLHMTRVSSAGSNPVTFRTTPISAPILQARLIPGTTVFVVFFNLFATGTLNQYLGTTFSFGATTSGGNSRGSIVTTPVDTLIGTPPGPRQFTFVVTGSVGEVSFLRWSTTLSNTETYRTIKMRIGYIGYSLP